MEQWRTGVSSNGCCFVLEAEVNNDAQNTHSLLKCDFLYYCSRNLNSILRRGSGPAASFKFPDQNVWTRRACRWTSGPAECRQPLTACAVSSDHLHCAAFLRRRSARRVEELRYSPGPARQLCISFPN